MCDSPFHKRTFSLPFGSVPLLPRCTSGDDSDWHLVTNCAKHSSAFPPLFASYRHLNVCLTSCVSIAIISRRTLQTFAWRMCIGVGEKKEKEKKRKKRCQRGPRATWADGSPSRSVSSCSFSVCQRCKQAVSFCFFPSPRRWVFRQNALLCNLSLFSSLGETQRVLSLTGAEIKALVGDNCSQFAVWNVCF